MSGPEFQPTPEKAESVDQVAPIVTGPKQSSDAGSGAPPPTASSFSPAFDWLTEVLIPGAVFGLLASFLYYLIDLRGAAGDRGISGLRWVCFWFLLGTILTTRMRSRYGAHILALPYMAGLALAMVLFVFQVTMFSGAFVGSSDVFGQIAALIFNYALVGFIWWIAGVVTRACTAEENFEVMADQGLLTSERPSRRRRAVKRAAQPRHPGWVLMWVSVAALFVFALGQSVVLGSSPEHRRHAFWCMVSYSFFALLLLALTSLSALRMSARQRRIRVAPSITPVWAITSAALVAGILAMAALLPRIRPVERMRGRVAQRVQGWREPPETPWNQAPAWGSRRPRADAGGERRADQDEGVSSGAEGDDTGRHAKAGEKNNANPMGGQQGEEVGRKSAGASGSEGGASAGGPGSQPSGGQAGAGASTTKATKHQESSGGGSARQSEQPQDSGGAATQGQGQHQAKAAANGSKGGEHQIRPQKSGGRVASGVPNLLKLLLLWLLILLALLLLALLLAYLIYRLVKERKNLPSFRGWLGALWDAAKEGMRDTWLRLAFVWASIVAFLRKILGWRLRSIQLRDDGLPVDPFADIFADRVLAESLSPAQVVRHVYAAFQAFTDLIGYPRKDNMTPYEFCRSLPGYIGGMPREDADELTALYVKAAYSPQQIDKEDVETIRAIWDRMQGPIDQALANRKRPGRTATPAPAPA